MNYSLPSKKPLDTYLCSKPIFLSNIDAIALVAIFRNLKKYIYYLWLYLICTLVNSLVRLFLQ